MQKTKKLPFKGASCAIITPFLSDGKVDRDALSKLITRQISEGTDALTVLGTTGEAPTVSDREHHAILSLSVESAGGRIPVIGGCGSNDTHHAVYLAESAEDAGCDAVLAITPYYNKASRDGLIRHFSEIAGAVSIPIILYNVPQRTGVSIPFEVYRELSEVENIVAVKDASGDLSVATKIISELSDRLYLYSGNDELTLPLMAMGACGVISVASNVLPREMTELCKYCLEGNFKAARELHMRLLSIFGMLSCEVNPIPVKYAASIIGLCRPYYRLPLCRPSSEKAEYIKSVMKNYGFDI